MITLDGKSNTLNGGSGGSVWIHHDKVHTVFIYQTLHRSPAFLDNFGQCHGISQNRAFDAFSSILQTTSVLDDMT